MLGIRLGTVEFHVSASFDKVGVSNRAALIAAGHGRVGFRRPYPRVVIAAGI